MKQPGQVRLEVPMHDLVRRIDSSGAHGYLMEELAALLAVEQIRPVQYRLPCGLRDLDEIFEISCFPIPQVARVSEEALQCPAISELAPQVPANAGLRQTQTLLNVPP